MRHLLLVLLLAFAILAGTISGAKADAPLGVAFPPDNCSASSPFMSFNGPAAGHNTYCSDGQFVLKNALPNCTEDQEVVFHGTKFICQDITPTIPTCSPGSFLTSTDGKTFTCVKSNVPNCSDGEVLTYTNGSFTCVKTGPDVPTCGPNQFLTYNGTFQCANVLALDIPNCSDTQVLTKRGGSLQCVEQTASGSAPCTAYSFQTNVEGGPGSGMATYYYTSANTANAEHNLACGGHISSWPPSCTPVTAAVSYPHGTTLDTGFDFACGGGGGPATCVDGLWMGGGNGSCTQQGIGSSSSDGVGGGASE
jgi:hypothetical protein